MIAPDPQAEASRTGRPRSLSERLPAEGPILALGQRAGLEVADHPRAERRALDEPWESPPTLPATEGPSSWRAIVVSDEDGQPVSSSPATLERIRRALDPAGRLFVIARAGDGDRRPASAVSDVVGALYEAGFCVTREDPVAGGVAGSDSGAVVIEARVDEHVVRPYRDGDESAILRLFEQSFSPGRGLAHWRWKYRDNPFGTLAISAAIAPGGDLVAHYAAYPVPFRRSRAGISETVLCHQVGDTMTDRHHRHVGRGPTSLLGRTARHFYARRCDGKVAFNYGFNTGNIQRFSQLFVGARKVWDIEVWSARAEELRLARPRRFRPYRVTRVQGGASDGGLDEAFDRLFERTAPHYGLLVERRRPYLAWRYLRCPDVDYRLLRVDRGGTLVGWGVTRADGDRVLLGDALFDPEHVEGLDTLLRSIVEDGAGGAQSAQEPRIEGWFARHPAWWSDRLAALGFAAAPQPQGLGMVFVPFLECPQEELRSSYYLTMGDSDLF